MRLAVDARLMAGHPRGMGQYARALVEPVRNQAIALLPRGSATTEWKSLSAGGGFFPWWEQVVLPRLAARAEATHLLCPSNTGPVLRRPGIVKIVVVHDLIFMRPLSELSTSPSLYQNLGRVYRRHIVPRAVATADVLVTVSDYTRNELCERFGISPDRVHLVPNSVGQEWFADEPLADQYREPYLLTVSGEAPSKNISALLRAFAELIRRRAAPPLSLRIAGIKPDFHLGFSAEATRLGIGHAVRFEGHLSPEELRQLYRRAWGFVLPSLYEGFGIPLLEAMASGTPVACSNTTSLPEVVGSAAWLFDPRDVESMVAALSAMTQDHEARRVRAQAGIRQAALFSRPRVSEQVAKFWNSVR